VRSANITVILHQCTFTDRNVRVFRDNEKTVFLTPLDHDDCACSVKNKFETSVIFPSGVKLTRPMRNRGLNVHFLFAVWVENGKGYEHAHNHFSKANFNQRMLITLIVFLSNHGAVE